MISYQGAERQLYAEGLRVVAAVAAARAEGRGDDAALLVQGYHRQGREWGVAMTSAWAILYAAAQVTVQSVVHTLADAEDTTCSEVAERMVGAALESVATDAL
ncbi:MAG: hypothetical protein ABIO67_06600 [Mycobacteriales bacterium]